MKRCNCLLHCTSLDVLFHKLKSLVTVPAFSAHFRTKIAMAEGPKESLEEEEEYKKLLENRLKLGQDLLERCGNFSASIEGAHKLARKIKSEIKFLDVIKRKKTSMNASHVKSTNLSHLEGVVKTVETAQSVSALFKPFRLCMDGHNDDIDLEATSVVDVVAGNGSTWIKVIARNPFALHRIWEGEGQYGDRDLVEQAQEFLDCSQQNKFHFMPPTVVFSFHNSITEGVARALMAAGVYVWGQVIADPGKELECPALEAANNMSITSRDANAYSDHLNLDVSTMIAYVSSVTNGGEMLIFKDAVLASQAEKERTEPLLPKLMEYFKGKTLYACRSAVDDFNTIIKTIGGLKEKERARQLLERLTVVADAPSERASHLTDSASIKTRSKIVFGTGDSLQATTVTANASFVRGARSQGADFSVFLHDSRALTESKEDTAIPFRPLSEEDL